jgi:hypothetical protein
MPPLISIKKPISLCVIAPFCRPGPRVYLNAEIAAVTLNPMTLTNAPAGSEIIFLELVALFLTAATVWGFLYAIRTLSPDEFEEPQFFWTILFVIIPFVMLVYFGLDVLEIKCPAIMLGYHNRPDIPAPITADGFYGIPS